MFGLGKKDMKNVTIGVRGMSCEMCVNRMRKAFEDTKGVEKAEVSLDSSSADITYDANKLDVDALKKIVISTGYETD